MLAGGHSRCLHLMVVEYTAHFFNTNISQDDINNIKLWLPMLGKLCAAASVSRIFSASRSSVVQSSFQDAALLAAHHHPCTVLYHHSDIQIPVAI